MMNCSVGDYIGSNNNRSILCICWPTTLIFPTQLVVNHNKDHKAVGKCLISAVLFKMQHQTQQLLWCICMGTFLPRLKM